MNPDALAAVVAAARLLIARAQVSPPLPSAARWDLAHRARVRGADAGHARHLARAASRWSMSGRLRG